LFCPTTTPFEIQDVVPVISKPRNQVEIAWKILQPNFGGRLHYGCSRTVAVPNFFDVIAMSVLIEMLATPQSIEKLAVISLEVAEEVAIIVDQSDLENLFEESQVALILLHLSSWFNRGDFQVGVRSDFPRFSAIIKGISGVFKKVQLSIESNQSTKTLVPCQTPEPTFLMA